MADAKKDPSELTNEELEEAIKGNLPGADEADEDLEQEEEDQEQEDLDQEEEDDSSEDDDSQEEEDDEEEDKPEPKVSRREALRVKQLLAKYGTPEEKKTAAREIDGLLDYSKELNADPEVIKKLEEDRKKAIEQASRVNNSVMDSVLFHTRLEIDAPRVEAKYPFLDKHSKDFDADYAEAMNLKYLHFVGYDPKTDTVQRPDVRYADFVEAEVEFANRMARMTTDRTRTNAIRTAAKTGLRPDGSTVKKKLNLNKAPEEMTDEELKAYLDRAIPKL